MVRTFIALPLPQMIQQSIAHAGEVLHQSDAEIKDVAPLLMHITLKFLGEVSEERIKVIATVLKKISMTSFEIRIGPISANSKRNPRVIWAQVSDEERCLALFTQVEQLLVPLGFSPESRPFQPHITVARVKRPHQDIYSILDSLSSTTYGSCTIDRCVLMKSVLSPQGPVYSELTEVRFEPISP